MHKCADVEASTNNHDHFIWEGGDCKFFGGTHCRLTCMHLLMKLIVWPDIGPRKVPKCCPSGTRERSSSLPLVEKRFWKKYVHSHCSSSHPSKKDVGKDVLMLNTYRAGFPYSKGMERG